MNDVKVTDMQDVSKDPQTAEQAGMMRCNSINVKSCVQVKEVNLVSTGWQEWHVCPCVGRRLGSVSWQQMPYESTVRCGCQQLSGDKVSNENGATSPPLWPLNTETFLRLWAQRSSGKSL